MFPSPAVQFGAVRIVHFRDVTRKESHVPDKAETQATEVLSEAIQDSFGRVPVIITRLNPDEHTVTDPKDWLLLTGPNADNFLNDIGGIPETEMASDGMWHFLRGVAKQAQKLPPITVDLVPWSRLVNKGLKHDKHGTPIAIDRERFSEPKLDKKITPTSPKCRFAVYNMPAVLADLQRSTGA